MMISKQELQGHKTVKIFGTKYVIRKINPLIDFAYDAMPQIFSDHITRRPTTAAIPHPTQLQKAIKDMKSVVQAGLVKPELIAVGKGEKYRKESGITVDDLFIDDELGSRLYLEIIAHSLARFGHGWRAKIKSLFFSIRIRRLLFTAWRKNMAANPLT